MENDTLQKFLQTTSALPCRIYVSRIYNLKTVFELTSSVLSTTLKRCFEQSVPSFLVCFLIFIEYELPKL